MHQLAALLPRFARARSARPALLAAALLTLAIPALAQPLASQPLIDAVAVSTIAPRVNAAPSQDDRVPDDADTRQFHAKKRRILPLKVETIGDDASPDRLAFAHDVLHLALDLLAVAQQPTVAPTREAVDAAPRGIVRRRMPPAQAPPRT